MGRTTYRNLYSLVKKEIERRLQFKDTKSFRNQLDRAEVGPLFNNPISDIRASDIIRTIQTLLVDALPGQIIS